MPGRLLLATPDVTLADATRALLASSGWCVHVATETALAVSHAQSLPPDVLVLDDRLAPVGDGDAAVWLRRIGVHPKPRVFMIGAPDAGGADLRRPLRAADVLAAVQSLTTGSLDTGPGFELDHATWRVRGAGGAAEQLTPTEYRLLNALLEAEAAEVPAGRLAGVVEGASSLRMHLTNLRAKLRRVTGRQAWLVARRGTYRLAG